MGKLLNSAIDKMLSVVNNAAFHSRLEPSAEIWDTKERDQLSVRVYGEALPEKGYDYRGSVFMFVEDMHNSIMPYLHISREPEQTFTASIEPTNSTVETMVTEGLRSGGPRYRLVDALCDFVRKTAQTIFLYGCTAYEIVCERDDKGGIKGFGLVPVNPLSLKKFLGNYYQFIPSSVAEKFRLKAGIIRIPEEKIVYIEIPKELGGGRTLRKILKRLFWLSQELVPDFHLKAMRDNKNVGFNLEKYTYERYIEQALLTKNFGWNQRKVPDENILEYYSLFRRLKKNKALTIVREKIIESINQTLNGPLLNLRTSIEVEGIQTTKEIEEQLEILRAGNINFVDVFNKSMS